MAFWQRVSFRVRPSRSRLPRSCTAQIRRSEEAANASSQSLTSIEPLQRVHTGTPHPGIRWALRQSLAHLRAQIGPCGDPGPTFGVTPPRSPEKYLKVAALHIHCTGLIASENIQKQETQV